MDPARFRQVPDLTVEKSGSGLQEHPYPGAIPGFRLGVGIFFSRVGKILAKRLIFGGFLPTLEPYLPTLNPYLRLKIFVFY